MAKQANAIDLKSIGIIYLEGSSPFLGILGNRKEVGIVYHVIRLVKMDKETLQRFVNQANELLASELPNSAKKSICMMVEDILHGEGKYRGFQYNYWSWRGMVDWIINGKPQMPEKERYIVGPNASLDDSFTSKTEGEYSRKYY